VRESQADSVYQHNLLKGAFSRKSLTIERYIFVYGLGISISSHFFE